MGNLHILKQRKPLNCNRCKRQIGNCLCTAYEFYAMSLSISAFCGVSCLVPNLCLSPLGQQKEKTSLKLNSSHSKENASEKEIISLLAKTVSPSCCRVAFDRNEVL